MNNYSFEYYTTVSPVVGIVPRRLTAIFYCGGVVALQIILKYSNNNNCCNSSSVQCTVTQ